MNQDRLQQLLIFLQKSPTDSFTLYSIAYEYMRNAQWEKAIEFFERLRQTDPDYVGLYYHLGKVQEQLDEVDAAFEAYKTGMQIARKVGNQHALGELERAHQQLKEEEEWT